MKAQLDYHKEKSGGGSSMDLRSLDFHQGRVKVFLMRSKLRSGLYGSAVDDTVSSPSGSPLGEWMSKVWVPKYSHLPETGEMERLNRNAHDLCSRILHLSKRGQIVEAREAFKDFDACSDEFLQKLQQAEQRTSSSTSSAALQ